MPTAIVFSSNSDTEGLLKTEFEFLWSCLVFVNKIFHERKKSKSVIINI